MILPVIIITIIIIIFVSSYYYHFFYMLFLLLSAADTRGCCHWCQCSTPKWLTLISIVEFLFLKMLWTFISHLHCFVMSRHYYVIASIVIFINFLIFFSFVFYLFIIIIFTLIFFFFSFYFSLKNSFSRLRLRLVDYFVYLFVCLFCFLSWNCRVTIHNFITFLLFPKGLQFCTCIAILT